MAPQPLITDNDNLPDPLAILRTEFNPMPTWLASYQPGTAFPRKEFFSSRIVYYPGSGSDGYPLQIFGKAHAAHCFVFADYTYRAVGLWEQLAHDKHPGHPIGYHTLVVTKLSENELKPHGWTPHFILPSQENRFARQQPNGGPYAIWSVMERTENLGEDHGPKRISLLHLGWEAVTAFDAFFCQRSSKLPYAILLQDHGFGGNWTIFGGEASPLWKLVIDTGKRPPAWLLVANNTNPWPGYNQVSAPNSRVGMYGHPRALYRRIKKHSPSTLRIPLI
jgi:hypothetical protein